jgi:uncharacterized protein YutE (UPF0331/DUF86 family)
MSAVFSPSGRRMVDRDLILRRLANLDTYLEQLAPYRAIEVGAYVQDWKTQRVVERTLHLAIETCMDVADHILADRRLRVPETGAESFEILADAGLLPKDLGTSLGLMVGFRNILVHDYTRLDPAIVIRDCGRISPMSSAFGKPCGRLWS